MILIEDSSLSSLDSFKGKILEGLKNAKYEDLEDMVYRFQLTRDEFIDILDLKYIPLKRTGYRLPPGMYAIFDLNFMLIDLLPKEVKLDNTIAMLE